MDRNVNATLAAQLDAYNVGRVGRRITTHYVPLDETLSVATASAYDVLSRHAEDPITDTARAAYGALGREVDRQYRVLVDAGYVLLPSRTDPYPGGAPQMQAFVRDTRCLSVYASDLTHPILSDDQNLRFRFVHDLFGHAAEGYTFGPRGEWNACLHHAQSFSPLAQLALFTETAGQNAWVNFGPHRDLPASERPYARQVAAILPDRIVGAILRAVCEASR